MDIPQLFSLHQFLVDSTDQRAAGLATMIPAFYYHPKGKFVVPCTNDLEIICDATKRLQAAYASTDTRIDFFMPVKEISTGFIEDCFRKYKKFAFRAFGCLHFTISNEAHKGPAPYMDSSSVLYIDDHFQEVPLLVELAMPEVEYVDAIKSQSLIRPMLAD